MLTKSRLRALASGYLAAYAAKDLGAISNMITKEVSLQDWNLSGKGADFFLAQTKKNFDEASAINIETLEVLTGDKTVAARLVITVDNSIVLEVVDVISFDSSGKITAIQAYKG